MTDRDVTDRDAPDGEGDEPTDPAATSGEAPAAPPAPRPTDVRAVLDEIGAEEAVARLDARVAGVEQDLERVENRAREGDRARRGELDVMRARVQDALTLVHETMDEQRTSWSQFEERFSGLVSAAEEHSRTFVAELRDELTPRVQRALVHADEVSAELKGELRSVAEDLERRAGELNQLLSDLRATVDRTGAELGARLDREVADRTAALTTLEDGLTERIDAVASSDARRHEEVGGRVEALRRELDAAVGELRAGLNLRAGELREELAGLQADLAAVAETQDAAVGELERRWIDGTRDIVRRVEQTDTTVREAIQAERASRLAAGDELGEHIERVGADVEELGARVSGDLDRQSTSVETLKRTSEELANRLDVLQGKVAEAVSQIASGLTNRVATVTGGLEALREASTRQQERLAALEHLGRRVDALEARETAPAPAALDDQRVAGLERQLDEMRQQVEAMSTTLSGTAQQTRELGSTVSGLAEGERAQEGLRQEVRELAARTSELGHRLEETERLARTAGQAIASAVRRAQAQPGRAPTSPSSGDERSIFARPASSDRRPVEIDLDALDPAEDR